MHFCPFCNLTAKQRQAQSRLVGQRLLPIEALLTASVAVDMTICLWCLVYLLLQQTGRGEMSTASEVLLQLVQQNNRLADTVSSLRTEVADLQQQHNAIITAHEALVATVAQYSPSTLGRIGRRPSATAAFQRRRLSRTCTDPGAPELWVDGLCSCTGGLLVNGRNITAELDELAEVLDSNATNGTLSVNLTTPEISTANPGVASQKINVTKYTLHSPTETYSSGDQTIAIGVHDFCVPTIEYKGEETSFVWCQIRGSLLVGDVALESYRYICAAHCFDFL